MLQRRRTRVFHILHCSKSGAVRPGRSRTGGGVRVVTGTDTWVGGRVLEESLSPSDVDGMHELLGDTALGGEGTLSGDPGCGCSGDAGS